MKPEDKFGHPICPATYTKMRKFAEKLIQFSYIEASQKQNLFYKKAKGVVFFADMRGTEEVPIWDDPRPLLYIKFETDLPEWEKRRIFRQEYAELGICRASFYEECEPEGLLFGEGGDGYCIVCHRDFQADGLFCSKRCEEAYEEQGKERCSVCGKELTYSQLVSHHIDYPENKTIQVCRSCHMKIHRSEKLPRLKPAEKSDKS